MFKDPFPNKNLKHAWYKFYVYIKPESLSSSWSRDRIVSEINEKGFPAFSGSCSEIYREKCISSLNLMPEIELPVAKELGETSLMFLIDQTITKNNLIKYAEAIKNTIERATK